MIELLKDKYRVIRKIGKGGMAEIHLAEEIATGRKVAIKFIIPDKINDHSSQQRFKSEIELTKRVDSPYVVKVYDYRYDDKLQYIVLEHIDGAILKDYIDRKVRLSVDETVEFAKQLALGFDEIHRTGIIHRDIKSTNIMVAPHGAIKIIDFGIAIPSATPQDLTQEGNIIASPQYIAPEIVKQTVKKGNIQTDIYALGILIFEMLTGKVPYKESTAYETAIKHSTSSVPRVSKTFPNVPNSLSNVIAKATYKNPHFRYKSMYEMFKDLELCLTREKMNEPDFNPLAKPKKTVKSFVNSKWFLFGMIGVVIALLLAIIVAMLVVFVF